LATGAAVGDVIYSARELMPSRRLADDGVTATAAVCVASVMVGRLSDDGNCDAGCCCCDGGGGGGLVSSLTSKELSIT